MTLWYSSRAQHTWASWPYGSYPPVQVPESTGKHPRGSGENGDKWAVITTVLVCSVLGAAVLAAAAYVWLH